GAPALVCCGQPMTKLEAKTQDAGKEKHVPVVEETKNGVKVKVGSIDHPMEEKHYIKFIEILMQNKVVRAELKPLQRPEAEFCVKKSEIIEVREYCTVHGLWR
ncbi:MAG: desulfoferrodoxin family protein, partial [Candidatus Omnitrophica bacterium]|nr:desulfoferrodoxin family protein [Candidatus Omnitrophota bacterium]